MRKQISVCLLATVWLLLLHLRPDVARAQNSRQPVGIFEDHQDVGTVLHPGSTRYDGSAHTYTVTGSGNNMWSTEDDFQFAWKKMSGDVGIAADISILG